jgi:hypothetical protein
MKKVLLLVLIVISFSNGFAQSAAKSMYVELGGPGLASINFDTRFFKKDDGLGGRVGIGYFKVETENFLTVPVALNYLLSKNQRNYFEIGGGITFVRYSSGIITNDNVFDGTFGHLNFGYRLQPKEGGFLFRAFITPVFGSGNFIPYYGGVAFGYKF